MMTQLSHKHLILNYGVCVCGEESECRRRRRRTETPSPQMLSRGAQPLSDHKPGPLTSNDVKSQRHLSTVSLTYNLGPTLLA